MADTIDLDALAIQLKGKIEEEGLSVRAAAKEIGCGAATLSRLLQGSDSPITPDLANVDKAAAWVGKSISQLSHSARPEQSTIADVEVHLRALPGLNPADVEALVAMVKAGYESAKELRAKKLSQR
jgi:transcriptional regulator with XRE-family HTH domain